MLARSSPLPLHRFPLIDTRNPDDFRDLSVNVFGVHGFDRRNGGPRPGKSDFRATMNWVWLKHIDLGLMKFNASYGYRVAPNMVRQQFPVSGSAMTTIAGRPFAIDHDSTCVIPTGADTRHDFSPEYAELRLRIREDALESKLGAMIGMSVGGKLRFRAPSNFRNPDLMRLRRLIEHLVVELDDKEDEIPDPAVAQYEQSLIACFLFANRHNFSHLLERRQPQPAVSQVRRAEEFIEANSSLPIAIEALAAVTGVGALGLSVAFKKARGMSPLAFLKCMRLKHARRMLQAADAATTVAAVAVRFGFSNSGRFAGDYRQAFGELPSQTLANSRRRNG
jgi:AraC-like DNA-binding protein